MKLLTGPRHRLVLCELPRVSPWPARLAALLFVLLFALGAFGPSPAWAGPVDDLKAQAVRMNDRCRSDPADSAACEHRRTALNALMAKNICWDSASATPETLWKTCVDKTQPSCARIGSATEMIANLRDYRTPAADTVTALRNVAPDAFGPRLQREVDVIYAEFWMYPPHVLRALAERECRAKRKAT